MKRLGTLLVVALFWATPAGANPQDVANDIAREMMSPYCPGVTLHDCPSDRSRELRARIVAWGEDGLDKDQIWDRLESEFGSDIRASPSTDGSGLWAWVLPIAATAAGVVAAAVLARRWSRREKPQSDSSVEVTSEQRQRLDLELAALRDDRG